MLPVGQHILFLHFSRLSPEQLNGVRMVFTVRTTDTSTRGHRSCVTEISWLLVFLTLPSQAVKRAQWFLRVRPSYSCGGSVGVSPTSSRDTFLWSSALMDLVSRLEWVNPWLVPTSLHEENSPECRLYQSPEPFLPHPGIAPRRLSQQECSGKYVR